MFGAREASYLRPVVERVLGVRRALRGMRLALVFSKSSPVGAGSLLPPAVEYDRDAEARDASARRRIVRYGVWSMVGEFATWALIVAFGQNAEWALTPAALVIWLVMWHLVWVPVGLAALAALRQVRRLPAVWVVAGLLPWVVHSGWVAFIALMALT